MLARVVTLRFDPVLDAIDDTPLQEFLKAKEVFAIREHFFIRNEIPYLAVLVTYGLRPMAGSGAADDKRSGRSAGWRPPVPEADLPLWNALREWRAERAKRDGVPTYVIATNRQLAAMVERRPGSISALGAIDGIGKAKLEKYGQELLALVARPHDKPGRHPDEGRGLQWPAASEAPAVLQPGARPKLPGGEP